MQNSFHDIIVGSRFINFLMKIGSSSPLDPEERRKRISAVFSLLLVIVATFAFSIYHIYFRHYAFFALDSLVFFVSLFILNYLRKKDKGKVIYWLICIGFVVLFSMTTIFGRAEISLLFWTFVLPPILFSLLGHSKGLVFSLVFFFLNLFVMSASENLVPSAPYSKEVMVRAGLIYSILTFIMYYYESSQNMLITYIQEERDKFENASKHDLLTGLSNRRDIIEKIETERERHLRISKPFSIIMGDIDNFKKLNDTFGHDAGDYVLKKVGSILKNQVRGIDCPARWGGEEFLIMLVETDIEGGQRVAERIRKKIENTNFNYKKTNLPVTMTFGLSIYQSTDDNIDTFIKRADKALYEGKTQGKNRVVTV